MKVTLLTSFSGGNAGIKMCGIARYSIELYKELQKKNTVELVKTAAPSVWLQILCKTIGKDFKTILQSIPLTYRVNQNDIFHCTAQTLALPLLFKRRKVIVTVHDIIPLATNKYCSFTEKILFFFICQGLKRATHIISDSIHTKKDIIKFIRFPKKNITVIPLGVDHNEFFYKNEKRDKATVLYVGSDAKRKNIATIIKAVSILKKEMPNIRFVKVGQAQDNVMRTKLKKMAVEYGIEKNIIWKDYTENLVDEYNKATIFVFPSLYEGFGFPVLEAMACGCPVITTRRTSIPEIAENAALYIDGADSAELAEKIKELITNKKLQNILRKKGLQQAKKFTWKKCAKETINVYNKILQTNEMQI